MNVSEAIEWLKQIKDRYIRGGDEDYDAKRKTALDMAIDSLTAQFSTGSSCAERLPEGAGVFFRGMKIPESCFECPMVDRYGTNPIWATFRCRVQEMPPIYVSEAKRGRREGCPAQKLMIGIDLGKETE